jgi:hypothetical protein
MSLISPEPDTQKILLDAASLPESVNLPQL